MTTSYDGLAAADRFALHRRLVPYGYDVTAAAAPLHDESPVAQARVQRTRLKADVRFWADDAATDLLWRVSSQRVIDAGATYDVVDATGGAIGTLAKEFGASLLRSTWRITTAAGTVVSAVEAQAGHAVSRRLWQWTPVIGDTKLRRSRPAFAVREGDAEIGSLSAVPGKGGPLLLEVSGGSRVDRRLLVAWAVVQDAFHAR